ncbi:uracil permease [Yersinia enterocolitica]|nr:uracil permease [Yersinia enterocolitica]
MANNWFPTWRKLSGNLDGTIIAPDERLPVGATLIMGLQHAVAMFGATVLMPLLMGFDANLAILMSGIGTLLFFLIVGGGAGTQLSWLQCSICRSGHCRHWLYRQRP